MIQRNNLELERCPHCSVANPLLGRVHGLETTDHAGGNKRFWSTYRCASCGGLVLVSSPMDPNNEITDIWPASKAVSEEVPSRAREFLSQAISSLHAPAGAVMLAGSAVDAMLKEKGFKEGGLHSRIEAAAKAHLITSEMAAWAHDIRLDANDQRHADEAAPLPDSANASKVIDFTLALAQFLYVLPARVERGRKA